MPTTSKTLRSRPRPALARALLLVALVLAAVLSDGAHHALERHAICPEHGELLHAARGSGDATAPGVSAPAQGETQGPALRPVESEPRPHEHCLMPALLRAGGPGWLLPTAAALHVPHADAPRAAHAGQRAHESVARLSLAPKHSPPPAGPLAV